MGEIEEGDTGMNDPIYKNIGSPEIRAIEECGEVIQAITKGMRFGWFNFHPDRPGSSNLIELWMEFEDLKKSIKDILGKAREESEKRQEELSRREEVPG